MTLNEVLIIKKQKSKLTKDMTTEQLNIFFTDSLYEFNRIIGKKDVKEINVYTKNPATLSVRHG